MTREFIFERSTKNTLRYQEVTETKPGNADAEAAAVGTIYVQKWVFAPVAPQRIRVTIEEVRDAS